MHINACAASKIMAIVAFIYSLLAATEARAQTVPPQPTIGPRTGQSPTPNSGLVLKAGIHAPEFRVERFLKGEPFSAFERGQVYVLDFWATWCGPCLMAMPHLAELLREYRDQHVTICGVNVWQDPDYGASTLATVSKFVKNKGDLLDFTIAYDGAAKHMDTAWLRAAGRNGIPCAFVVDRDGVVAWIGHPEMLDMVLDEVARGTWDIASGPERLMSAAAAFADAATKYSAGLAAGDVAWEEAMRRYPAMGRTRLPQRFGALLRSGHIAAACALGSRLVDDARRARNAGPIMGVLEALGSPGVLTDARARALLLEAAKANFELADATESGPHVLMARAYFFAGRDDEARAAATKALDLSPARTRQSLERWLKNIEREARQGR